MVTSVKQQQLNNNNNDNKFITKNIMVTSIKQPPLVSEHPDSFSTTELLLLSRHIVLQPVFAFNHFN